MQPISTSLARRQDFIKLLILGTLLAFGLNLLVSYVYGAIETASPYWVLIPLALILFPLGYAVSLAISARSGSREIEAMALFNRESREVMEIDRYSFSEDLRRIIVAVTKENPAFQEILSEDLFPTAVSREDNGEANHGRREELNKKEDQGGEYIAIVKTSSEDGGFEMRSSPLLIEAIEFAVLKELSLHLSSYFNDYQGSGDRLIELTREHIPDVLLKNRVLALLTTPIEERPIFRKSGIHKNPPKGTVHSIWSRDGVMFERFDLIVPSGSKLDRPEQGRLELTTKRGVVRITIRCHGFNANLPRGFESLYMRAPHCSVLPLAVDIQVETRLKLIALLTPRGWDYYRWMDSFAEWIVHEAHFPSFLANIGWERALTGFILNLGTARGQQPPKQGGGSSQLAHESSQNSAADTDRPKAEAEPEAKD